MAISIGLPFYNAELFLGDAIRSVFAQTYQNWELILIDDGSTDKSLAIAQSINDPRVRVYSDGKNKKLASRLNEIVELAKYDFIARMDADDLISPYRLEKQMNILKENKNIDLVSTGVYSVSNDLQLKGKRGIHASEVSLKELLFKNVGVVHAAILGRKEWFIRNSYDTSLKIAQDYDLWLRSSFNKDFNVYLMEEPLYYYREEGNATAAKLLAAYQNERDMYKKYAGTHYLNLLLKSYGKSCVVYVLSKANKLELLLNNRSAVISDESVHKDFKKEIEYIRNFKVPGLL